MRLWLLILILSTCGTRIALAERFVPPQETFASYEELRALRKAAGTDDPQDLARKIDALLAQHADELAPADEKGLISVPTFLAVLPPKDVDRIRPEYRRLFDAQAQAALDLVRQDPSATPEALYAVSQRYPLSSIASHACVLASQRALRLGDRTSASDYAALAKQAAPGGIDAASGASHLPIEQNWYGRPELVGTPMYFPLHAEGVTYFSGPKHVLAIKDNGQILWKWSASDAWAKMFPTDRVGRGRGSPYAPAMFYAPQGASILVVRQPRASGRDYLLRALRATDGKVLWSSDDNPALERTAIASSPGIAGRFVYATAVEFTDIEARLELLALDLLDGHIVFKAPLGTLPDLKFGRVATGGWDGLWEQSQPLVEGSSVYLTPNVGVAFAVDRFTGSLRWSRIYDSANVISPDQGRKRPSAVDARPTNPSELLRYRTTPAFCGQILLIAPQDSGQAWGVESSTGRVIWNAPSSQDTTLAGAAGLIAIFAGPGLRGIDAANGKERWTWSAPAGNWIAGPPIIEAGKVLIPLAKGKAIAINAADGQITSPPPLPDPHQLVQSEPAHRALEDATIAKTLANPTAPTR